MNYDLLLFWMTHIGEGSWAKFKSAVEEHGEADTELDRLCATLRVRMSDLCYIDFFVDGTQQWNTLAPMLGGLVSASGQATLCGGRTPDLIDSLESAAHSLHCRTTVEGHDACPSLIFVEGKLEELQAIAQQVGIPFERDLPRKIAGELVPIPKIYDTAMIMPAPLNWNVRSFDFHKKVWVDKLLPYTACEYIPSHGYSKYFVHTKRGKLLSISKREAIYVAALLQGIELIHHDLDEQRIRIPFFAPLPELFSRVASMCSGKPSRYVDGYIIYDNVPIDLAILLMVAAGQSYPRFGPTGGSGEEMGERSVSNF